MNCAAVTVTNGGSGLSGPTPFVANANVNECKTIENIDVVFPDPGPVVQYGGSYASSRPTTPAGFEGNNCVGPGATAGTPKASSTSVVAPETKSATTAPASSSPAVHEHVVSTEGSSSSTSTVATDVAPTAGPTSSTGTASAPAVTTTTKSLNGKVSDIIDRTFSLLMPSRRNSDARQGVSTSQIEAKSGDSTVKNGWRPWRLLGRCLVIVRVRVSGNNTDDEPHCMCLVEDVYLLYGLLGVYSNPALRFASLQYADGSS